MGRFHQRTRVAPAALDDVVVGSATDDRLVTQIANDLDSLEYGAEVLFPGELQPFPLVGGNWF